MGEVPAYGAISFWQKQGQPIERPEIEVKKGDLVVFKLASSDVVHGFSLKDFGIYLTDGIQPGTTPPATSGGSFRTRGPEPDRREPLVAIRAEQRELD